MINKGAIDNMRFIYSILENINAGRKIQKSKLKPNEVTILNTIIEAGSPIILQNGYYFKNIDSKSEN